MLHVAKSLCPVLINILVLAKSRPFPKLGHKSRGPDSRKRVIVGRSFLVRCGDYKRRISSAKGFAQNSSKMERFLYWTTINTLFLPLLYSALQPRSPFTYSTLFEHFP